MPGSDRWPKPPAVWNRSPSAWQHGSPSQPPLGPRPGQTARPPAGTSPAPPTKSQPDRLRIPRLVVSRTLGRVWIGFLTPMGDEARPGLGCADVHGIGGL